MAEHCEKSELKESKIDHEMLSMVISMAILVGGFFVIAFVSGPFGLAVTLLALAALGLYYVFADTE